MLQNVPNAEELEATALRLYFEAWRQVMTIMSDIIDNPQFIATVVDNKLVAIEDECGEVELEDSQRDLEDFVRLAQPDLQLCYALVQQCQELALKAIVCKESPFLLLLGSDVRAWGPNKDFTDLRTIDASDIVKVVNGIRLQSLSDRFVTTFNDLRKGRNKIAHLGAFKDHIDPLTIVGILIDHYLEFYPDRNWLRDNLMVEVSHRYRVFQSDDFTETTSVLNRLAIMEEAISENQRRRLLGFSMTARLFQCHECQDVGRTEFSNDTAATLSLEKGHHFATCRLCEGVFKIVRKHCKECQQCDVFLDRGGPDDVCCYCGSLWDEQSDD